MDLILSERDRSVHVEAEDEFVGQSDHQLVSAVAEVNALASVSPLLAGLADIVDDLLVQGGGAVAPNGLEVQHQNLSEDE